MERTAERAAERATKRMATERPSEKWPRKKDLREGGGEASPFSVAETGLPLRSKRNREVGTPPLFMKFAYLCAVKN